MTSSELCGHLIVGGFDGPSLPERYARALGEGRRAGAILFRRNLPDLDAAAELCQAIVSASALPPFIGVDQEGGRVTRLPAPFLTLPPMRELAARGDAALVRRAASAVGAELSALGFNLDFAPVLDVDSNPDNPIIGDRAFSHDPELVLRYALAFAEGLADEGVLACGKHFPGHGDTSVDSHVALPVLAHDRARLEAVELIPFRAAARAKLPTLMTAHVVCDGVDPGVPATLSERICTALLRDELGFEGVLFSDDLEMAAVAARYPVERSAVAAIRAGCDVLLVCKDEDLQDRAHEALVREVERDAGFRARCEEAARRALAARTACPPRPVLDASARRAIVDGPRSRELRRALQETSAQ
jgi:beta-N-acetylhexosaminidase